MEERVSGGEGVKEREWRRGSGGEGTEGEGEWRGRGAGCGKIQ